MVMLMNEPIAQSGHRNWRLKVDHAWRSGAVRREFETECGVRPLRESDGSLADAPAREAKNYYEQFVVWATRKLRLEREAPAGVRAKL
jgi:hypothetical protein